MPYPTLTPAQTLGRNFEQQARSYLEAQGCTIRDYNVRKGHGEVDIIAQQDPFLLFVEVKVRSTTAFGYGEQFVSKAQQEHYRAVAESYTEQIGWEGPIRFDVAAFHRQGGTWKLTYFKDAF